MGQYNIKSIREEFKSKGIFYTQPELAEYMKSLVDIDISDVYDPTCGDGSLLSCFPDELPKTGLFGDVRFNEVPALPPKSKADYAFLLHIVHLLSYDGIAIVLNFPGILYRGNSEGIIRKWFIDKNYIEKVIHIPGKTFIDTTIATSLLILKKNKNTTNVEFIDNENKLSRVVPFDEIVNNDYNLSVNSYVQKEVEKVIVDTTDLQKKARLAMCKRLRKDIEMDKMICELEGWDFNHYLDDLKNVVNSYYNLEISV